jgi:alkylation response protein AidB-like acyl-CoA dehydrogenase
MATRDHRRLCQGARPVRPPDRLLSGGEAPDRRHDDRDRRDTIARLQRSLCAYDHDPGDAIRCARLAKSSASDTAMFCANRSTQLHGGIGFTWEADVQIYHKRQLHSQFLFGDGAWQRQKLADLL